MPDVYRMKKQKLYEMYGGVNGLTGEKVQKHRNQYGENILKEEKRKSIVAVFLGQFADLLVIILMIAAVVSMLSHNLESSIVIFVVIVLNAVLGTVQYVKAEKSLDSLKELSAPKAKVLRDGMKIEIAAKEVVPGDVLMLEAGDLIAADGRIIANYSLQVNESALTGESLNVDKKDVEIEEEVALADRYNMVFSGSLVTYGRADVLVTATGMNTEMGKIAVLMNDTKNRKTPLQVSLDDFSKKLAVGIFVLSAIVFGLRLFQGEAILDSFLFAVALAVAAIPEALGSIVTIVQAMGTRRMAMDHAIIKDLKAVESLGCVSVICSDKTGTLTQNKMTVKEIYIDGKCIPPEKLKLTSQLHRYLLYNAVLNNDSSIQEGKEIGDPTETCLLTMARKAGFEKAGICEEDIRSMMPRIEEIPFDSERKRMSTKYRVHGVLTIFTKGAPDGLLSRLKYIATTKGVRPITEEDKEQIERQNIIFAKHGLRVLAFAYKECSEEEKLCVEAEKGYTFLGLAAMMDPPREESKQAVADAIGAGMKPIMITGDYKVTAIAIAKQIGIFQENDLAVTGAELNRMSEKELKEKLEKISVYARVSPENKIRIVDAWQKKGKIVAMTGDGVNDAPALKKADIGVAMGRTGTEVAKDASAMILADDNFATIIQAVLNGRNVYRNIMNAIQFLLSGNMAGILVVFYCSLMALPTPLEALHLLFINLLTDSLPALAIGMEPLDYSLLKQKPRDTNQGILTKSFFIRLFCYGSFIAAAVLIAFYIGLDKSNATAATMAFATLTLARLFHGLNFASKHSGAKTRRIANPWSVLALVVGMVLLFSVLLIPTLQPVFLVTQLSTVQLTAIVILALIPTIIIRILRGLKQNL